MIKNSAIKIGFLFFVSFIVFGCTGLSSSLSRQDEVKSAAANYQLPKFPEEGKAIIYVVRPSIDCKPFSFKLFIDNKEQKSEMGSTIGRQYIYFDITPGEHKILSKVDKWDTWAEINVSAKAGDIIFIQQEPDMGFITLSNKILTLQDYEGKYYVKTLTRGTFSNNNQQNVPTIPTQARLEQSAKADTFTGTVTGGTFAKGVGFSNMNVRLEVTSDNGDKTTFFVRSDSKVVDTNGKQINYLEAVRSKGKKIEIEYFTITDGTGGDPSRSDFTYEIGQKGVRLLRFLD